MNHEHTFITSDKIGYEVCLGCGSYHSYEQVSPKVMYEDNPYWGTGTGRSGLPDQVENLLNEEECGISKVDMVLQYVPHGTRALEIACAPGIMLKKLSERYSEVYGIEPSEKYIGFICRTAPLAKVIQGYFPEVTKPIPDGSFDCIVGMDVFEHCDDTDGFINEAYRLLSKGGVLICMSPIIFDNAELNDKDFLPMEHAWIYSGKFLNQYLREKFSDVQFGRWQKGHELIICKK